VVLAPLVVLGSLELVGPFEPGGWQLAGALVPLADIGWSIWLLTLGSRRRGMERPLGPLQLMDRGQPPVGSHGRFGH
jgi:hypothetical protein